MARYVVSYWVSMLWGCRASWKDGRNPRRFNICCAALCVRVIIHTRRRDGFRCRSNRPASGGSIC